MKFTEVFAIFTQVFRRRHLSVSKATGNSGEKAAALLLKRHGWTILGRNVRPNRNNDELDIIASKNGVISFVEVKTRTTLWHGLRPEAFVDTRKKRALARAATDWLRKARHPRAVYRFDIIEVLLLKDKPPEIRHIENAFPFPQC